MKQYEYTVFSSFPPQVVEKATEFCGNITAVNTIGLWGTVNHVVLQNNCRYVFTRNS